jgi:transposase-like protein
MTRHADDSPFVELTIPYPKNRIELAQWFGTEEACLKYLASLRWAKGYACPQCGGDQAWAPRPGMRRCKSCRHRCSVTAGTIFDRTRKPLPAWFEAIWHVCGQKNGGSALALQRSLGLSRYETAWSWLHRLRRAMVAPGRSRLTGEVEVDETFIGGVKPGVRGRGAAGRSLVLIAAEIRGVAIGRIRLQVIPDATAATLLDAISDLVVPGSDIVTDGWTSYTGLPSRGFNHTVSRATPNMGGNLLPHVHRVAAQLKRWLLGTHQGAVGHDLLQFYLDEFVFRFNRRTATSRGLLFRRLLEQSVAHRPVTNAQLLGKL